MTLLKQETLFAVIEAAIEAGLRCEDLVRDISQAAQASLVLSSARSPREQYLSVLSQLNEWRVRGREQPPLRTLVSNMQFLAGNRQQAHVFERALAEIDNAPSRGIEQGELLFTRTKDCYVERGYRVVPPVDAPVSLTFQAWRGTSDVSVIGVAAVASLDVVIEATQKLVQQLKPHERVEGCVVLLSDDPKETEQVHRAGLVAVPYRELARMGVREIQAFVDRQQAALAEEAGASMSPEDDNLRRELRAALRESPLRVVMLSAGSVLEKARRIVLSLTSDYLRNPSRPAPLLLRLTPQPVEFKDLVAAAFNERRVPFSRFDFPGLLAESAFLPVFVVDSPQSALNSSAGAKAALQALAAGGKVVLITPDEAAIKPEELARRWRLRAANVRTLSESPPSTKGGPGGIGIPFIGAHKTPPGDVGPRRFEQGKALLVGVANYPRISRLPESVLNDARDIAALLRSPTRCGYPENNVEVLLDQQATAQRFRAALQRLAQTTSPNDTVVVYFSGHGARKEVQGRDEGYLLPFDCDPTDLERTALSARELSRLLSGIKASRLVVLLDACHAAGAAHLKNANAVAFKSGLDDTTYEALGRGAGRVVMASSRADEASLLLRGMKNSLFTAYLLEALEGTGKNRDDDVIRVLDVFHHIAENVPRRGPQHPILKAQDVENNFAIALNLRTKQASPSPAVPNKEWLERSVSPLSPKARIALKRRLVQRWEDLADYFGIPLLDKAKFNQGYEGQRTLEWLEERGRLDKLRDAFTDLGWDDLVAELDRHSS